MCLNSFLSLPFRINLIKSYVQFTLSWLFKVFLNQIKCLVNPKPCFWWPFWPCQRSKWPRKASCLWPLFRMPFARVIEGRRGPCCMAWTRKMAAMMLFATLKMARGFASTIRPMGTLAMSILAKISSSLKGKLSRYYP